MTRCRIKRRKPGSKKEEEQCEDCFGCLPQDIRVKIVSWLPMKSVIQFRAVCRPWNLLYRDPFFLDMILAQKFTDQRIWVFIIYHRRQEEINFIELPDPNDANGNPVSNKIDILFADSHPDFRIIGSCNSLLCLINSLLTDKIYIYNPFTRSYKSLPVPLPKKYVDSNGESFVFGFLFGFGYHPATRDYTVVNVAYSYSISEESHTIDEVYVYTLSSNRWKSAENLPSHQLINNQETESVLVNGRLHWMRRDKSGIISFDMVDNLFREVPMDMAYILHHSHSNFLPGLYRSHLAVLDGCLSLAMNNSRDMVIWVLKEYGVQNSWLKLCSLGEYYQNIYAMEAWMPIRVLCLVKNGDILLSVYNRGLVFYNPHTQMVKEITPARTMPFHHLHTAIVSNLMIPSALCF